jgi:Ca2+-transporting ATPase
LTSVALRDNKPETKDGMTSLLMLPPQSRVVKHQRKGSVATLTSSAEGHSSLDGTEPDHSIDNPLMPRDAISDTTSTTVISPTHTHFDDMSIVASPAISEPGRRLLGKKGNADGNGARVKKKKGDKESEDTDKRLELVQDDLIDPSPFAFKPFALASLLDPKDLRALEKLGGMKGLLLGLGTNHWTGLGKKALLRSEAFKVQETRVAIQGDGRPGAGVGVRQGASQRHDRREDGGGGLPGIVVTTPEGKASGAGVERPQEIGDGDDSPAFHATLDQRRQIYGDNVLPHRPSKTLLQHMLAAWSDKVLVCDIFSASYHRYSQVK